MWSRSSLRLAVAPVSSVVLAASMFAQQVPNPIPPGPSGTGDGLTRDALDATSETAHPPANPSASRSVPRHAATAGSSRKSATYANIPRRHRAHRAKKRGVTMYASMSASARKRAAKPRAPLVSFIYWWNGWVVRTFHTRAGTVLLDTIGAKS